MIAVSDNFIQNSKNSSRLVMGKIEIDWSMEGYFVDESDNQLVIEVERRVNEPLGGISIGIADIELSNANDRYTPPIIYE